MKTTLLILLIVGQTAILSFGQEGPPKESPSKDQLEALGPGDHTRSLMMGEQKRTYLVHVPKSLPLDSSAGRPRTSRRMT